MKYLVFLLLLVLGCDEAPKLEGFLIGVRDGQSDRVTPVTTIKAGTTMDLAASVTAEDTGWIYATWTYWPPDQRPPRVVASHQFNVDSRKTIFAPLGGDTLGPWPAGRVTCDFKTGDGESVAGVVTVLTKK